MGSLMNPVEQAGAGSLAPVEPSKAQRAVIRYFARTQEERAAYTRMALSHNARHDEGWTDPYSKSLGARDALVDLILRSIYDRPYLSVLGPVVAIALYLVVLFQLASMFANFLGGPR